MIKLASEPEFTKSGGTLKTVRYIASPPDRMAVAFEARLLGHTARANTGQKAVARVRQMVEQARQDHELKLLEKIE